MPSARRAQGLLLQVGCGVPPDARQPTSLTRPAFGFALCVLAALAIADPAGRVVAAETDAKAGQSQIQPDTTGENVPTGSSEALRADDLERTIWFVDDLASYFGQIAESSSNKHAKAAWLILEENYRSAAQTLDRLLQDKRLSIADLPGEMEATVRDGVLVVDRTLAGTWSSDRFATARRLGGNDWDLISQLSSVLIQQLGAFRSYDQWAWYRRHLKQSAAVAIGAEDVDPALASEIVRFAVLKDKYVLSVIRAESAASADVKERWRRRSELVAIEATTFINHHAASFDADSAALFARSWRDYAQSANQAADAYASVTFSALPGNRSSKAQVRSAPDNRARKDVLWPPLSTLIAAVPERVKSHAIEAGVSTRVGDAGGGETGSTETIAEPAPSISTTPTSPTVAVIPETPNQPAAPTLPDNEAEQTAEWRDRLSRQNFQPNGITVPIRDETGAAGGDQAAASDSLFVGVTSDGARESPGYAASETESAQGNGTVLRTEPPQPAARVEPAAERPVFGLAWLEQAAEKHSGLIAFLPVIALLAVILLVVGWMWRSLRDSAEEPLILTAVIDDDFIMDMPTREARETSFSDAYRASREPEPSKPDEAFDHAMQRSIDQELKPQPTHDPQPVSSPSLKTAIVKAKAKRRAATALAAAAEDDEEKAGPNDLVSALRSGNRQQFETLFEQLSGLSRRDVRELLRHVRGEELAVVCKAIGLDQLVFASLVIMARRLYLGENEAAPLQISNALAAFNALSRDDAIGRVQSWSIDTDFSTVEDFRDQGSAAGVRG